MPHEHHHHDNVESALSFEEKITKLLAHWIKHNDDHAITYNDWAQKAKNNRMPEVAKMLEAAAEATRALNERFESMLASMEKQ